MKYIGHLIIVVSLLISFSYGIFNYTNGIDNLAYGIGALVGALVGTYLVIFFFCAINRGIAHQFAFHDITRFTSYGILMTTVLSLAFGEVFAPYMSQQYIFSFLGLMLLLSFSFVIGGMVHISKKETRPRLGFQVALGLNLLGFGLVIALNAGERSRSSDGYSFYIRNKLSRFTQDLPARNADEFITSYFKRTK